MPPRISIVFAAVWSLSVASLVAAPQKLQVDHTASRVEFVAKATMHSVEGWIESWELELSIPEGAELPDVVVFRGNGATMTTDHKKRDAEMHTWMEHEKLPEVEFRLRTFSGTPEARVAEGDLILHGVTLPIAIPVKLTRDGAKLTVIGEVVLDTTRFGLRKFRKFGMLSVDPEVKVTFSVTGKLE